jgi:hypothetical protein
VSLASDLRRPTDFTGIIVAMPGAPESQDEFIPVSWTDTKGANAKASILTRLQPGEEAHIYEAVTHWDMVTDQRINRRGALLGSVKAELRGTTYDPPTGRKQRRRMVR